MFEFSIYRASDIFCETRPCDEAYQVEGGDTWFVRFETLSEVMSFIGRYGEIVMREGEIVIYDYYIE